MTARYIDAQGNGVEEKGPKTTINITLHKKDESTNWGPGLPNTTVEDYDLGQIKGKDKTIKVVVANVKKKNNGLCRKTCKVRFASSIFLPSQPKHELAFLRLLPAQ